MSETLARVRARAEDEFLEGVEGDFIGVQNYSGQRVGPDGLLELDAGAERTQMGYGYQPEALEHAIRRAIEVTGLPAYVTENGLATDDDTRRIAFIERAVGGVAACLRDGLDVRGYCYWSLFDNFEWVLRLPPDIRARGRRPRDAGAHDQAERAEARRDRAGERAERSA